MRSKSGVRRSRLFLPVTLAVLGIVLSTVLVPQPKSAEADPMGTLAVGGTTDFLEIRDDGTLWVYVWSQTQFRFFPFIADNGGWGQTKLVALLSPTRFVEVKGDVLRTWGLTWTGTRYQVNLLETSGPGWATMRLITGVGDVRGDTGKEFIGVAGNGDLMLYRSQGNGYVWEERLDSGYEHARLIAGHRNNGHFVEVNDLGDLWEVTLQAPGIHPSRVRRMSGWSNVRLLGPGGEPASGSGTGDSFVSVRHDGNFVHWYWNASNYSPGVPDPTWSNAKLIG